MLTPCRSIVYMAVQDNQTWSLPRQPPLPPGSATGDVLADDVLGRESSIFAYAAATAVAYFC